MFRYIGLLFLIISMMTSCAGKRTERPVVAVTIPPVQAWVEAMAGDRVNVVCVVSAGDNPESYDPTPSVVARLATCKTYLSCGYLGVELAWLPRLVQNNPEMSIVNLSEGVDLIYGSHHHSHDDSCSHHHHGMPDPHIWCSPRRARVMLKNAYRELCRIDTDGVSVFTAKYDSLDAKFARLDSSLVSRLKPSSGAAFAVYHPTLTYWAADYGLHQIALEPDGKSPSPRYFRQMVDESRRQGVQVVFIQQEFDPKQTKTFADEVACSTQIINPLSYNWETEINRIADAFDRK